VLSVLLLLTERIGLMGDACDHGLGPITGQRHFLTIHYFRPWRRLFRKTWVERCWKCDHRRVLGADREDRA